jgi:hypothetical protein
MRSRESSAVVAPPTASLVKHPSWLLSRWGITTGQLSALLVAAAKLEQQATGPKSLSEPPEPWEGSAGQKKVRNICSGSKMADTALAQPGAAVIGPGSWGGARSQPHYTSAQQNPA